MLRLNTAFRKSIAVLLPLCFWCVFIGCVSLCTEHSIQRNTCESFSFDDDTVCNETDCCPITPLLSSVLPDRRLASLTVGNRQVIVLLAVELAKQVPFSQGRNVKPNSTAGPPFERLRTLRI